MLIELWLDGYNSEKEMAEACKTFVEEQLNFSGSGYTLLWTEEVKDEKQEDRLVTSLKTGIIFAKALKRTKPTLWNESDEHDLQYMELTVKQLELKK